MSYEFKLPSLGENIRSADVVNVLIKEGDVLKKNQAVLELETEKAVFELPASVAGTVKELHVKAGDKVQVGQLLMNLETSGDVDSVPEVISSAAQTSPSTQAAPAKVQRRGSVKASGASASPIVRRVARDLGVDLANVAVSEGEAAASLEDVAESFRQSASNASVPLPDFSKYGPIEKKPLNNLRKTAVEVLTRAWTQIPHVTQMDEADITILEAWRKKNAKKFEAEGVKLTLSAILLKFIADLLPQFPNFNASLDLQSEEIIYKKYIHLGVAVDTERGLMVPVIRDVNLNSLTQIAFELKDVSERARTKKLKPDEMQGASFTLTNLGSLGGTHFTPIINWPEVAVLGIGKSSLQPQWNGQTFEPRLKMPLSLSYDHRVIDGADGVRFLRALIEKLEKNDFK